MVQHRRQQEKADFLASLAPFSHDTWHQRILASRCKDTCAWLLHDDSYRRWKDSSPDQHLLLHGIAGCGKSVLAASIVEDLTNANQPTLYHYATFADSRSLETKHILGSLLKQCILLNLCSESFVEGLLEQYSRSKSSFDEDHLFKALHSALEGDSDSEIRSKRNADASKSNPCCLIDGLDECSEKTQQELKQWIAALRQINLRLRLVVTYREDGPIRGLFDGWSEILVNLSQSQDDVQKYVRTSIEDKIKDGSLRIPQSSLKQEIIEALIAKSGGL